MESKERGSIYSYLVVKIGCQTVWGCENFRQAVKLRDQLGMACIAKVVIDYDGKEVK